MGAWQDRNGSLAGQKLELGRTEMKAWQKIICETPHFARFSVIFVCFLPLLVGIYHIFLFFCHFWLFCRQERIKFWQDEMVGPPLKMTQLRLWIELSTGLHEILHCLEKVAPNLLLKAPMLNGCLNTVSRRFCLQKLQTMGAFVSKATETKSRISFLATVFHFTKSCW